jgi:hypothetical protein
MARGAKLLAMSSLPDRNRRLEAAHADLVAMRPQIEAGEPWPLSDNFGTEPEASWGPRETLAHLEEMLPYWQGEIERVLEGDTSASDAGRQGNGSGAGQAAFGRVAADELRVGIIERDRTLPLRELFDRIDTATARVARRLDGLAQAEFDRRGVHPRLGPMTVADIIDRFIVGHLEEHVDQLRDILGGAADATSGR